MADVLALPESGSTEIFHPLLPSTVLRLHDALTQGDLWHALKAVARDLIPSTSLTLEIGAEDGSPHRFYRHAHVATPAGLRENHPVGHWFALHPGAPVFRLSDITSLRELQGTLFQERVMKREGWDKLLGIVSWSDRTPQGTLSFYRPPEAPDFSPEDRRVAEAVQPHFDTALRRVLEHEAATFQGNHFAAMLEDVPVGLLRGRPRSQGSDQLSSSFTFCACRNGTSSSVPKSARILPRQSRVGARV